MYKTAFIFPGQGAQYIGMAKDFCDHITESKEIFVKASNILGFDMQELCFIENEKLNCTEYTQVAILTACISILKAIEKENCKVDITAGLSLGEYSALVANGVLPFEQAISLVRKRGLLMENEVPKGKGGMSAVLGLDSNIIEEICKNVSIDYKEPVELANYNCPGQVVISGEINALLEATKKLKEAGARRVLELKVSGPFHSSMLKGAGEKLAKELEKNTFSNMNIPYVSNVTAKIIKDTENIKDLLVKQVYSPVKWEQSVKTMLDNGVQNFVEIGPGKTLSGFIRKIDKTKNIINIEKLEDLEKIKTVCL